MMRRSTGRWLLLILLVAIVVAAPAAASDRFEDVDATSVHHDAVNQLSDAGIVAGCAEGRFCPRDALSREQMASLLARGLPRTTSDSSVASLTGGNGMSGVPASVTVEAPGVAGGSGSVTLQGSVSVLATGNVSSCPCEVEAFIYRDSDDAQGPSTWSQLPDRMSGEGRAATALPVSWTAPIPSGTTETYRIAVFINDGDPSDVTTEATLTAIATSLS